MGGRKIILRPMIRMGMEAIYRRPNLSKPAVDRKVHPYFLHKLVIDQPNQVWAKLAKVPTAKPVE